VLQLQELLKTTEDLETTEFQKVVMQRFNQIIVDQLGMRKQHTKGQCTVGKDCDEKHSEVEMRIR